MLSKEPWQPGMFCLSIYKEDGEAYEGLVKSIEGSDADGGQYAVVQFIGKSPFEIFLCWKHIRNRHFSFCWDKILISNLLKPWDNYYNKYLEHLLWDTLIYSKNKCWLYLFVLFCLFIFIYFELLKYGYLDNTHTLWAIYNINSIAAMAVSVTYSYILE